MQIRMVVRAGAVALSLAVTSCKSDKATGPGATSYAGTYSGIIAGATTSGTLALTIPTGSAVVAASAIERSSAAVDALVTLTGTLKLKGGTSYSITGSFDTSSGLLSGVTAGPYSIAGGFSGGKFTGTWTGPGGTSGGFSLLSVPSGGSALALCGTYTGASSGVWNLSVVGGSMVGEAAGSSTLRLIGTIATTGGSPYAMTNITSPDDATVSASGSLTSPANTASGNWAADGGSGTWSGSATGCN